MELLVKIELPEEMDFFRFPEALQARLEFLLNKQDRGEPLSDDERDEAEGLVEMADIVSTLRMRVELARRETANAG
jgi:hypothetical protein